MSDQRENQELNQRRRGLEAQLENSIRDTNTTKQETKDGIWDLRINVSPNAILSFHNAFLKSG
jgi:hypothetical protein